MNESARGGRSGGWIRGALAFLSLGELAVGIWALFLPRSFYEDFPSSGREWVSTLGPYDEHLVRDVGSLTSPSACYWRLLPSARTGFSCGSRSSRTSSTRCRTSSSTSRRPTPSPWETTSRSS